VKSEQQFIAECLGREMAKQSCYEIVHEYSDTISGVKAI